MDQTIGVKVLRLPHAQDLPLPGYQSSGASGMDLLAAVPEPRVIQPMFRELIPAGIALEMPPWLEAQVRPRSGLALKAAVTVLNTPGTVDSDYRGELHVLLANFGPDPFTIRRGDRIAQLVFSQVTRVALEEVPSLHDSKRGASGFGSTG